ncbi:MAG: hypothetical protein IOD08_28285 [Bradyrhizobium sp.]|uniref:hypothetical protein n=1 Tax=Bradyrhizobium sp. TaxID=376 RepID=UPI0025BAE8C6|nr:hypothetical protein [Bradyrhizobium sp.]MCA3581180.1 hypothetical protein [Bradyrhizobium sp.]
MANTTLRADSESAKPVTARRAAQAAIMLAAPASAASDVSEWDAARAQYEAARAAWDAASVAEDDAQMRSHAMAGPRPGEETGWIYTDETTGKSFRLKISRAALLELGTDKPLLEPWATAAREWDAYIDRVKVADEACGVADAEARANECSAALTAAEQRLFATRAPTAEGMILKLEIMRDLFDGDDTHTDMVESIRADLERHAVTGRA